MEARLIVAVMVLFLKFAHKWLCCIPTLQYMCILHRDHFEQLRIACLSNLVAMLDEWDKDIQYHIALRGSLNCTAENDEIIQVVAALSIVSRFICSMLNCIC